MPGDDLFIDVHLPFEQHSKLPVRPGILARDAIDRILEKRNIDPKLCQFSDSAEFNSRIDLRCDLMTLAKALKNKEIWVHNASLLMSSLTHKFKKISFVRCSFCQNMIWMSGGYRCERCNFNCHEKCSRNGPAFCDRSGEVTQDPTLARRVLEMIDKNPCRSADFAADILHNLVPNLAAQADGEEHQGGEITRQPGMRRHNGSDKKPYPRNRARSAPDINVIKDDFALLGNLQTTSMHSGFPPYLSRRYGVRTFTERSCLATASDNPSTDEGGSDPPSAKPSSSSTSLYKPSLFSNRLCPSVSPMRGNGFHASTGPTSTCSSPSPYPNDTLPGPSNTLCTPPQSAPPSKISDEFNFAPPIRSKSPGDSYARKHDYHTERSSKGEWNLYESEVKFGPKIGSGAYGTVYKGTYFGDVAIKVLNNCNPDPISQKAFKNEMILLKNIRHTNILAFMGCLSEPTLAIVTQWCNGSTLYHHIHVNEPRTEFTLSMLTKMCRQIVYGMGFLHAKNIIHRDLKTNNIFLHEDTIKIGDFGLATVKTRWRSGQQTQQPTGSILWMAPEVIRMSPHTTRSDVYSFGICLYELLSGRLPYDHINNRDQIIFMVGRGLLRPDANHLRPDTPSKLRSIFLQCIEHDPEKRPELEKVKGLLIQVASSLPHLTKSQSDSCLYVSRKAGEHHSDT